MKGNFKAKHALTVLGSLPLKNEQGSLLTKFRNATVAMIGEIDEAERANAIRGTLAGVGLLTVKASMGHGEWSPWVKENITGQSLRRVQQLMKLGMHFMEKARVDQTQLLSLTQGEAKLDLSTRKTIFEAASKFADGRSLTELLIARGIISAPAPDDDAEQESAGGGSSSSTVERSILEDVSEWLLNLRETTTDPEQLKKIPKRDIKALVKQVADYSQDLNKAVEALSEK
jgi:hypothetical protein